MKIKNKITGIFVVLLLAIMFTGCKKKDNIPPEFMGSWQTDWADHPSAFLIYIGADGGGRFTSYDKDKSGPWKINKEGTEIYIRNVTLEVVKPPAEGFNPHQGRAQRTMTLNNRDHGHGDLIFYAEL